MSKRSDTGFCISSSLGSPSVAQGTLAADPASESDEFSFIIAVRPPFRLDLTVWALRRRPINEADRWDGSVDRRTIHVVESL
jgi:hypothetical protein